MELARAEGDLRLAEQTLQFVIEKFKYAKANKGIQAVLQEELEEIRRVEMIAFTRVSLHTRLGKAQNELSACWAIVQARLQAAQQRLHTVKAELAKLRTEAIAEATNLTSSPSSSTHSVRNEQESGAAREVRAAELLKELRAAHGEDLKAQTDQMYFMGEIALACGDVQAGEEVVASLTLRFKEAKHGVREAEKALAIVKAELKKGNEWAQELRRKELELDLEAAKYVAMSVDCHVDYQRVILLGGSEVQEERESSQRPSGVAGMLRHRKGFANECEVKPLGHGKCEKCGRVFS